MRSESEGVLERETGLEPATSSLGNSISIENKKLMRRRRRILSTQVHENIDRTFPRAEIAVIVVTTNCLKIVWNCRTECQPR